jgi:hypothetical protein
MSVSSFNIVPNVVKPKSSALETVQWGLSIFGDANLSNYGFLLGVQDVGYGETNATGYWNCITPPPTSWMIYQNVGNGSDINILQAQNDTQLVQIANELVPSANAANRHEATEALINNNYFCPNFDLPDFQTYGLIGGFLTGWTPSFDTDNSGYYDHIHGFAYLDMTQTFPDGNNQPINLDLQDAVIFDGTNYLYMANNTSVPQGTSEFTASVWFKTADVDTEQTLFAWGNTGVAGEYVRLYLLNGELIFTTGDGMDVVASGINTDTWYNAAIQGYNSGKYLFLDGDYVGDNGQDYSISGQDVYIGCTNDATAFFTGSMNNFLFYNVLLSGAEINFGYENMQPVVDKPVIGDDFTVEWFMNLNDSTMYPRIFSFNQYPNAQHAVSIEGGTIIWWANQGARLFASNPDPYDASWHHVAITRNSGVVTVWFDGVSCGTTTYGAPINTTDNLFIGSEGIGTTISSQQACVQGFLSNFEYTVGLSKYNNTFTPPTAPLTADVPYTKLLNLQSTTNYSALLVDQSGNGNNATGYNSPSINVVNPFGDSSISLALDSADENYLVIPASSTFDIN